MAQGGLPAPTWWHRRKQTTSRQVAHLHTGGCSGRVPAQPYPPPVRLYATPKVPATERLAHVKGVRSEHLKAAWCSVASGSFAASPRLAADPWTPGAPCRVQNPG